VLVLFAVAAAAAGGYLVGDEGEVGVAAMVVGGAVVVALLLYLIIPAATRQDRVSLRPANAPARAVRTPQSRVLHPGEAARIRERERVLSSGGPVGLRLIDTGRNQIAVIKVLRNYLDIGLKEAKDISDAAKRGQSPLVTAEMIAERAREFAADIEKAGGLAQFEESGRG
jgi:ribosomal protein L7/L12